MPATTTAVFQQAAEDSAEIMKSLTDAIATVIDLTERAPRQFTPPERKVYDELHLALEHARTAQHVALVNIAVAAEVMPECTYAGSEKCTEPEYGKDNHLFGLCRKHYDEYVAAQ